MGRHFPKPPKNPKKPKPDLQLQAHEAALLRQQQEQQRKYDEERAKASRFLEPGEYPKGQVAHTRGWEPGDPLDTPSTKILVDGVEQQQPIPHERPHFGFSESDPQRETLGEYLVRSLPPDQEQSTGASSTAESDKTLDAIVQKLRNSPEVQKYLEGQRMVQGFWKSVSDGTAYRHQLESLWRKINEAREVQQKLKEQQAFRDSLKGSTNQSPLPPRDHFAETEKRREQRDVLDRELQQIAAQVETDGDRASSQHIRDIEKAIDKALKRAEDRAQSKRELEEFNRRAGFTPIGEDLPPTNGKSWIHRIPVWKEFGHWLKWASASFAFAVGMVGAGEYLVAEFALIAAILCCIAQTWIWQRNTKSAFRDWSGRVSLAVLSIMLGGFAMVDVFFIKGRNDWTHLRIPRRWVTVAPAEQKQPSSLPTPSESESRNELRAESSRPIRDVAFHVKLNRQYSIQELGHFRVIYEIFDNQTLDFFIGCQDAYSINTSVDLNAKQFGIRCTVHYRPSKYGHVTAIPVYTRAPKYTTLIDRTQSVDTLQWNVDLYNQIPSYKALEDLNRKYLYIFVTESLIEKINEVSFTVNNWELISAQSSRLTFPDDKPIAKWFLPLSDTEKSVKWRGVYLRGTEEFAKQYPAYRDMPWVWPLDFALIHPKKLPEPTQDTKIDPLR
jgi:hypothetical protein